MMDKITEMFFAPARWQYAIDKGYRKGISNADLYRLCKPEFRAAMYNAVCGGKYVISPPHTARIPKDTPGEFRTVYVNEPVDRVFLSIANDLLFDLTPDMRHPSCRSYLRGTGCGDVVRDVSRIAASASADVIGWKSDLSKYFDSVPIQYVDVAFDRVECKFGHSAIIDVLRKYYHCDLYFDEHNNICRAYQSLKQGCSVASWLADVLLYHIDERLSALRGYYVRYSDDMLFIGEDHEAAMEILKDELARMQMRLNPRKVELLYRDRWFKFLGFSIKGSMVSLSATRIKSFQHEIESRTTRNRKVSQSSAISSVVQYLYKGDGEHSWATQVMPVINVRKDIDTLNQYVMDALRAVQTGRGKIGGLGFVADGKDGCIARGTGKNVCTNRERTAAVVERYRSLGCMWKAMRTSRAAYRTLLSTI